MLPLLRMTEWGRLIYRGGEKANVPGPTPHSKILLTERERATERGEKKKPLWQNHSLNIHGSVTVTYSCF